MIYIQKHNSPEVLIELEKKISKGKSFESAIETTPTSPHSGFDQHIPPAACELWGHIPAADYRKIFTGLIFLKYISTAFEKKYKELVE